jgi:hypothetical protein
MDKVNSRVGWWRRAFLVGSRCWRRRPAQREPAAGRPQAIPGWSAPAESVECSDSCSNDYVTNPDLTAMIIGGEMLVRFAGYRPTSADDS